MKKRFKKTRISVIGLGYVGLSLAVMNARKGFFTIGVDVNSEKIEKLKAGQFDFFEPGISGYLKELLKSGNLTFTTDLKEAILNTDLSFLTVGTPSTKSGKIDLSNLKKAIKKMHKILTHKKQYHMIAVKSTVLPQTTEQVILPVLQKLINKKRVDVVVNPEFLREGNALNDLTHPHLIVIGEYNKKSGRLLEKYYHDFYQKIPTVIHTNLSTAEMIKYANNAFLATKISFINSIANICQKIPGTDVNTIAFAIGKDPRINPVFLNAGPGFGGSCLPKDLSAFIKYSDQYGDQNILFKSVKKVNELQPMRIIQLIKQMKLFSKGKIIAVLGLAFKKNTDDIRSAVSVNLVKLLIKNGLKVKVHDPMAMESFKILFGNKVSYCSSVKECLSGADCCVILTEWDQYKKLSPRKFVENMKYPNIVDARRLLDPKKFSDLNYHAIGLGV